MSITVRICGQESVYHGDDKLIVMTALICRGTCQNKINAQKVIGLPNDNKFTGTSRAAYKIIIPREDRQILPGTFLCADTLTSAFFL